MYSCLRGVEKSCEEFPQKLVPAGHEHFSTCYFISHSSSQLIYVTFDYRNSWEIFIFVLDVKYLYKQNTQTQSCQLL